MPLSSFVGVDIEGNSVILANGLLNSEETESYEWLLDQLQKYHPPPTVLLVDEDFGMEGACASKLKNTKIINCIWHIASLNLFKNFSKPFGIDFGNFKDRFWRARNALSIPEFEREWQSLTKEHVPPEMAGETLKRVTNNLASLYARREKWAWPWISKYFTAGMQSTQRVEQTNAYVKERAGVHTTFTTLFLHIDDKLSRQKQSQGYAQYSSKVAVQTAHRSVIKELFVEVLRVNDLFVGTFARNRMKDEMDHSIFYEVKKGVNRGSLPDAVESMEASEPSPESAAVDDMYLAPVDLPVSVDRGQSRKKREWKKREWKKENGKKRKSKEENGKKRMGRIIFLRFF